MANIKLSIEEKNKKTQAAIKVRADYISLCIANAPDNRTKHLLTSALVFASIRKKNRKYSYELDKENAKKRRALNIESRKTASNIGEAWTEHDDKLLLTSPKEDFDIAVEIGRTMCSCAQRRAILKRNLLNDSEPNQ